LDGSSFKSTHPLISNSPEGPSPPNVKMMSASFSSPVNRKRSVLKLSLLDVTTSSPAYVAGEPIWGFRATDMDFFSAFLSRGSEFALPFRANPRELLSGDMKSEEGSL